MDSEICEIPPPSRWSIKWFIVYYHSIHHRSKNEGTLRNCPHRGQVSRNKVSNELCLNCFYSALTFRIAWNTRSHLLFHLNIVHFGTPSSVCMLNTDLPAVSSPAATWPLEQSCWHSSISSSFCTHVHVARHHFQLFVCRAYLKRIKKAFYCLYISLPEVALIRCFVARQHLYNQLAINSLYTADHLLVDRQLASESAAFHTHMHKHGRKHKQFTPNVCFRYSACDSLYCQTLANVRSPMRIVLSHLCMYVCIGPDEHHIHTPDARLHFFDSPLTFCFVSVKTGDQRDADEVRWGCG